MRLYLNTGLFFYFKKIQVHNFENIPKNKPLLFLSNHQNALLDALVIATKCGRFSYFLTRAAVFNKNIIARFLRSMQMLPVYRIRDGYSNLSNNTAIFNECAKLLHNNNAIVIFPEGNHNLKRTVRPLSKGFTRIIFQTLEEQPKTDLQLQPVGLNFANATNFPDSAAIYFGTPFSAKDLVLKDKNESVVGLKTKVQSEISMLTADVPSLNYDDNIEKLKNLNADFLNPKAVNSCIASNYTHCSSQKKPKKNGIQKVFKALFFFNMILPYVVWKFILAPKVKELEFLSTFRFAVAITLFPLYLGILSTIIMLFISLKFAMLYVLFVSLLALGTTKF